MDSRRKVVTLGVVGTGAAVLVASGVVLWRPAVEQWHLWRLSSGNPQTRLDAVRRLGELKSLRAAPRLVEWILDDEREACFLRGSSESRGAETPPKGPVYLTPVCLALYRIGPQALPAVRAKRMSPAEYKKTRHWREWRADDALNTVEAAWRHHLPVVGLEYADEDGHGRNDVRQEIRL